MKPDSPPLTPHPENLPLEGTLAQLVNRKMGTEHCDPAMGTTRKPQ